MFLLILGGLFLKTPFTEWCGGANNTPASWPPANNVALFLTLLRSVSVIHLPRTVLPRIVLPRTVLSQYVIVCVPQYGKLLCKKSLILACVVWWAGARPD